MRVPQFLQLDLSYKARLVWKRIVISRLTIAYFIFSFVHFVIQLGLQLRAFSVNAEAARFLETIIVQGNATADGMPIARGSSISVCHWVSSDLDTDVETCKTVWTDRGENSGTGGQLPIVVPVSSSLEAFPAPSATPTSESQPPASTRIPLPSVTSAVASSTAASPRPTAVAAAESDDAESSESDDEDGVSSESDDDDDDGDEEEVPGKPLRRSLMPRSLTSTRIEADGTVRVRISGPNLAEDALLEGACLESLNWPLAVIRNTKREDIVFVAFQFWVLGMSMVAILNESIPHIAASLLTHVMATAWAAFQVTHTANFRSDFGRLVADGACRGSPSLLSGFWLNRALAEYPSLAMHCLSLVVSALLTWKLAKFFGWQTFKRVGASLSVNRMYKIVLILSIAIQLSLFFMFVTVSLWIDQLMSGTIGDLASFTTLYKAASFITLALLVPWLWLGWIGVRRELRLPMFFFLFIATIYLAGWGVMFFSTTFRWTFVTWRFFSVMASASVFLTVMSLVLGVICRFNFGKGMLKYLVAQDTLEDDDEDRSSIYKEKRDLESFVFPPQTVVPSYSSTYPTEKAPVYQYQYAIQPRTEIAVRQETHHYTDRSIASVSPPPAAITRNLTDVNPMARSNSNRSDRSTSTYRTYSSRSTSSRSNDHTRGGSNGSQTKRWVIE